MTVSTAMSILPLVIHVVFMLRFQIGVNYALRAEATSPLALGAIDCLEIRWSGHLIHLEAIW